MFYFHNSVIYYFFLLKIIIFGWERLPCHLKYHKLKIIPNLTTSFCLHSFLNIIFKSLIYYKINAFTFITSFITFFLTRFLLSYIRFDRLPSQFKNFCFKKNLRLILNRFILKCKGKFTLNCRRSNLSQIKPINGHYF
jgi:hypothetical protein